MNKSRLLGAVCACLFVVTTTSVNATTIDFIGAPEEWTSFDGEFIDSNGFRFTVEQINTSAGFIETGFARDLGGLLNANDARFEMSAVDGSLFDLISFDFTRSVSVPHSASMINVTGFLEVGGTVSYTTSEPLDAFTTANLPQTFVGLTSVLFDPVINPNNGQFDYSFITDNIVVNTIPIPAALWLFGSGLLGLVGIARKKVA